MRSHKRKRTAWSCRIGRAGLPGPASRPVMNRDLCLRNRASLRVNYAACNRSARLLCPCLGRQQHKQGTNADFGLLLEYKLVTVWTAEWCVVYHW